MYEILYLSFFFNIILGSYSLINNYKSKLNILFSILAFVNAGIIITNPLIIIREYHLLWEKVNIFFVLWTPTLYLMWSFVLSRKKLRIKDIYLIIMSTVLSLSLLTNLLVADLKIVEGRFIEEFGPLFNLFFIYYIFCFGYGLYTLLSSYRKEKVVIEKRKYLMAFIGTLIPISTSVIINFILIYIEILTELKGNILIFPITNSIMMVFFSYAVFRYGFLKSDITIKEKLDTLRIKILYITNIIIIGLGCIVAIIRIIVFGYSVDETIIETFFIVITVMVLIDLGIHYSLSKYIHDKIVTPLEMISRQSEEVGKGNFNLKVGFEGDDELAVLSRQMDEMTEKLERTSQKGKISTKLYKLKSRIKQRNFKKPTTSWRTQTRQRKILLMR